MANLIGESTDSNVAAVKGENTGSGGFGVLGICATGHGVHGQSITSKGVVGESEGFHGVFGKSRDNVGVAAESQNTEAMNAQNFSGNHAAIIAINHANGVGIQGRSGRNVGVLGESDTGRGIMGTSNTHIGVSGDSQLGQGVRGTSVRGRGTEGFSTNLEGVFGSSKQSTGVLGISEASGTGVSGESKSGRGVHGISDTGEGVHGQTSSPTAHAVVAFNHALTGTGAAIYAEKKGDAGHAGFFAGNVHITKKLVVDTDVECGNGDCAEDFDIAGADLAEPGTVMVLGDEGALYPSQSAYDKRVVGVVSGAGDYRPAIILDKQHARSNRKPIALLGKVFCKAEAISAPIKVGDLLTTSDVPGHAMKAVDPATAFGSVIGKALRPLKEGQGLIPILVTLQ